MHYSKQAQNKNIISIATQGIPMASFQKLLVKIKTNRKMRASKTIEHYPTMHHTPQAWFMKTLLLAGAFSSLLLADFSSFSNTKKELIKIYDELGESYQKDFYCQAPFSINKKGNHTKLEIITSEFYSPRIPFTKKGKPNQRAQFIEWEHIVPAENFGKHLLCWQKGGRKACQKDENFRKMEADPYNLVPAIGEINGDRSNYKYAQANAGLEYNQYGNCKVYTDFKNKRFYPADHSKGYIARTYLYFEATYKDFKLSKQEKQLMEAWDKMYPQTKQEHAIREKITQEVKKYE